MSRPALRFNTNVFWRLVTALLWSVSLFWRRGSASGHPAQMTMSQPCWIVQYAAGAIFGLGLGLFIEYFDNIRVIRQERKDTICALMGATVLLLDYFLALGSYRNWIPSYLVMKGLPFYVVSTTSTLWSMVVIATLVPEHLKHRILRLSIEK